MTALVMAAMASMIIASMLSRPRAGMVPGIVPPIGSVIIAVTGAVKAEGDGGIITLRNGVAAVNGASAIVIVHDYGVRPVQGVAFDAVQARHRGISRGAVPGSPGRIRGPGRRRSLGILRIWAAGALQMALGVKLGITAGAH